MVEFGGTTRFLSGVLDALVGPGEPGLWPGQGRPVPDLVGRSVVSAIDEGRRAGLHVSMVVVHDDRDPPETVLLQRPPAGVRVGSDRTVLAAVAVHGSRACTARRLTVHFRWGGVGAGNMFGALIVRDIARQPCELSGYLTIRGLDSTGSPDTRATTATIRPALYLTPVGGSGKSRRSAAIDFSAEYRDDPGEPDGLCQRHQVIPWRWQLRLADGTRLVARNDDPHASDGWRQLLTCRGELNSGPATGYDSDRWVSG